MTDPLSTIAVPVPSSSARATHCQTPCDSSDETTGAIAFFEEGLKLESFGGMDGGVLDWNTPNQLASLGDSEDVLLFANMTTEAAYDEKAQAYLEALMETAIDAGAEDVREDETSIEVITAPNDFEAVRETIEKASIAYVVAEVTMLPQTTVNLEGKEAEQMMKLMETLEDCEDVQKIYTNADIPDELVV